MSFFYDLFHNYLFVSAALGWLTAQVIKTIIDYHFTKELNWERLVGSGGMPSSHSATVCALATAAGWKFGAASSEFAICAFFAIIVMYDARGVRRETGNQAVVLNKIMEYFSTEHPEQDPFNEENLKELIGHTPLQVFVGAILGILIAGLLYPSFR
ncbi:MAG: divergent PAP2 family protein [Lachnospiraceae bacterium]|nr:divergent PAP2 family protein [Lachnospiraceae bacterium]MBR2275929.1 divergent PAP2 family protein [Lachnospiraceae bacterium]